MRSYKDLEVWKLAFSLARDVYQITEMFPARENYGLSAQLRRAAVSVPSNIAEGQGRYTRREHKRFLRIALGSLFELETEVLLAADLGYVRHEKATQILRVTDEVGRMISGLVRYLTRSEREAASSTKVRRT